MQNNCEVCREVASKYKCPKCEVKYCSVQCYKQHKEVACKVEDSGIKPTQQDVSPSTRLQEDKEDGELSDTEMDDFTEDKVEKHVLARLGESQELRTLLGNPHVRVMMSALAEAEDPGKMMDAAMKEPIFTEFADECLKIVEHDQT